MQPGASLGAKFLGTSRGGMLTHRFNLKATGLNYLYPTAVKVAYYPVPHADIVAC